MKAGDCIAYAGKLAVVTHPDCGTGTVLLEEHRKP